MTAPPSRGDAARKAQARIDALAAEQVEWAPWLHTVRETVGELSRTVWDARPVRDAEESELAPWLAGATLRPPGTEVARLLDRLRTVARSQGLTAMAGPASHAAPTSVDEALEVFMATINDDVAALTRQASSAGATLEGWRALTRLLPIPYLHACARHWAGHPKSGWSQGYCPVCGAWAAFAEVRGIERSRHLRCGRCGAGWAMPALKCTYCGTADHEALGSLVAAEPNNRWSVDICRSCRGYLKTCTTLQPTEATEILLADLSSVMFDLAAVEHAYLRPQATGVALHAAVVAAEASPQPDSPPS